MVRVRARATCFIDNKLRQAGSEFDYTGELSDILVPLEDEEPVEVPQTPAKKKAKKKAAKKKLPKKEE